MRFSSSESFGGQRASVGRIVVLALEGTTQRPDYGSSRRSGESYSTEPKMVAGVIREIIDNGEGWDGLPIVQPVGGGECMGPGQIKFRECKTEADLLAACADPAALPFWTWPPRV